MTPFDMLQGYERKLKAAPAKPRAQATAQQAGLCASGAAAAASTPTASAAATAGKKPGIKVQPASTLKRSAPGSDSDFEDLEELEEAAARGILSPGTADAMGRHGKQLSKIVAETTRKMAAVVNGRPNTQLMDHGQMPKPVSACAWWIWYKHVTA